MLCCWASRLILRTPKRRNEGGKEAGREGGRERIKEGLSEGRPAGRGQAGRVIHKELSGLDSM